MLHAAAEALKNQKEISLEYTIANTDRACGAMLSGTIAAKYGEAGLPEHTLNVKFKGSAGQSFGAFLVPGVTFRADGLPYCLRYALTSRPKRIRLQETPCSMVQPAVKFTSMGA